MWLDKDRTAAEIARFKVKPTQLRTCGSSLITTR